MLVAWDETSYNKSFISVSGSLDKTLRIWKVPEIVIEDTSDEYVSLF